MKRALTDEETKMVVDYLRPQVINIIMELVEDNPDDVALTRMAFKKC